MDDDASDYFRKRKQEELDAAEEATSEEARRIHLELAEEYAERSNQSLRATNVA